MSFAVATSCGNYSRKTKEAARSVVYHRFPKGNDLCSPGCGTPCILAPLRVKFEKSTRVHWVFCKRNRLY